MSHKRALEAGALRHLVEPLDPAAAPPECRDTPGYIARLLEDYHLRVTAASARHPRNPRQSLHSISTSHNGSQPGALQAPVSPMDTLADTALSTSPTFAPASRRASQAGSPGRKPSHWSPSQHARQTIVGDCARDPYGDRPTKRARSEALPSPFQNAVNSRPASSHNPSVGLQHNVEQGVYNAERKRQLSQAERDILEFMEGLKAQRREGNPSPWLSEQPFPLPILEELHAHANGEVPPPSKAQLGQPLEDVASSGTALRAFQSAMEEQAPAEQSAIMDSPNDAESAIRDPSVRTTQTHTPPEEKPPSPVPADHGLLKSDEAPIKSNANSSKSGLGGRRRASKGVEQQKDGQTLDAPQQLESPQSLLVDFHEGRQPESISQATESHTGSPLDLGLLPRPRSALGHLDPREPVTLSPAAETRSSSVPPTIHMVIYPTTTEPEVVRRRPGRPRKLRQDTICAACHFSPNALTGEPESWLQCNGCKKWFHFACAGIKNEREVRNIDKFHCKECTPKFGKTTR
ncbi:MAG: hypothetical protein INR71_01145 [Terriglobus roseus]|nr:hypothetical protein [Terriglobus roseus]